MEKISKEDALSQFLWGFVIAKALVNGYRKQRGAWGGGVVVCFVLKVWGRGFSLALQTRNLMQDYIDNEQIR